MRTLRLISLAAVGVSLAGCEFIVDPQRQGSTTAQAASAAGSSTAANGTGSTSTTASNGSGSGTQSTSTTATTSTSTTATDVSTSSGSSGHNGPGSNGSSGNTNTTGTSVTTTNTSGTNGVDVASSTSGTTSTIGTGTIGTGTTGITGTTSSVNTSGVGSSTGTTSTGVSSIAGTGTSGTTNTSGVACAGPFGTSGGTQYSCSSPYVPTLPIHPSGANGQQPPAFSDILPMRSADSRVPPCGSAGCSSNGDDNAYAFSPETLCGGTSLTNSDDGISSTFSQSDMTQVIWQANNSAASMKSSDADDYCRNGFTGVPPSQSIALASPAYLIALLDFGAPPSGTGGVTPLLPSGFTDPLGAAETWAENDVGDFFTVNFATGAFGPVVDQTYPATARCAAFSNSINTIPPSWDCTTGADPNLCKLTVISTTPVLTASIPATRTTRSWANALSYCNNLTPCHTWRLPNYKELAQLANFTQGPLGEDALDNLSGLYWSSTPAPMNPANDLAMAVDFEQPSQNFPANSSGDAYPRDSAYGVICVQ